MPLYFAYGSNMDQAAMRRRCPASRAVGVAQLARHRFVIMRDGYASVMRDPRRTVWGLLWDLALADIPALDRYEAIAEGLYVKARQPVLTGAGPRQALIYVGRGEAPGAPRAGYMEGVVAAARAAALPADYLRELETWLPTGCIAAPAAKQPDPPLVRPIWSSPVARAPLKRP